MMRCDDTAGVEWGYRVWSIIRLERHVTPSDHDVSQACATIGGATNPAAITRIVTNARRLLAGDAAALAELTEAAAQRLAVLTGEAPGGPLAAEWEAMVERYEQVRSAADGRAFRATRTRTMRIRHGVLLAIERLVKAEDTEGVRYLITAGAQDCSLEAIVLRHPRLFGAATARQARAKLAWQPPKAA